MGSKSSKALVAEFNGLSEAKFTSLTAKKMNRYKTAAEKERDVLRSERQKKAHAIEAMEKRLRSMTPGTTAYNSLSEQISSDQKILSHIVVHQRTADALAVTLQVMIHSEEGVSKAAFTRLINEHMGRMVEDGAVGADPAELAQNHLQGIVGNAAGGVTEGGVMLR